LIDTQTNYVTDHEVEKAGLYGYGQKMKILGLKAFAREKTRTYKEESRLKTQDTR